MPIIPTDLHAQLRKTLLRCGPFDTDANLRSIFIDERLYPWREDVPEANARGKRVDTLIENLHDQYNPQGENALVLFLRVLADRTSSGDACHHEFMTLATQLAALPMDDSAPIGTSAVPTTPPGQNINVGGTGNTVTVIQQNAGDNATQIGQVTGDVNLKE